MLHARRSLLALIACVAMVITWGGAGSSAAQEADRTLRPSAFGAKRLLVVHWTRMDGDSEGWNVWAWLPGRDGASYAFDRADAFGRVAVIPVKGPGSEAADRVGIIVRKGDWQDRDGAGDRFVDLGTRAVTHVWLVAGDPTLHPKPPALDRTPRITAAFLDARDRVTVASTVPLDQPSLGRMLKIELDDGTPVRVRSAAPARMEGADRPITAVQLARPVKDDEIARLRLSYGESTPCVVHARGVLEDPAFVAADAELGARCGPERTMFRTWSPVSSEVELLLYASPAALSADRTIPLRCGANGTWETTVEGDLHGTAYAYRFSHYGERRTVPDIHGVAATRDSQRSVVVDLARAQPEGWRDDVAPPRLARATDEVIYEIHVRDFTVADRSCPPAQRGTYLGLVHSGQAADGSPTALAHLKKLGVTAVHLMPVHDFTAAPDAYNWGYWTALFNVPESNFASESTDPVAPVRELRAAVDGLHRAGIRVILDVVYNHTSSSGAASPFDGTVPFWFFRTTPDGRYTNDAGCGNSVADERAMVRKYILDSLAFWLREYRIDGFRFDLLGTHVPETVRAAVALVRSIRPDATLYGEPWTGGGPIRFGKGAQRGTGMAVFNDHIRNAIRGDLDGTASGFATGPGGDAESIRRGVAGAIDDFTASPAETVNYASAHDNLTLVDKIAKAAPGADPATRRAMQKLAIGIVLVSQGIPFLEGGSEICRTKGGNHNSYEAGDGVNRFDWDAAGQCSEVSQWVAGMIALRRAHAGLRLAEAADVRRALRWVEAGPVVAWTIDGRESGDSARRLLVALNGEPVPQTFRPPLGTWRVLADDRSAGTEPGRPVGASWTLPPYSMLVAEE